ncbi:HdaA/DnaA family protein [Amorphus orientalis]|uniref:Chromosomal replication initiation ATPase DnaA n=1 Tax=Amorphus orientalis TaxID=649198 RepID=A0AAE3VPE1_9HYPH|nr:hypothetical protein [Amorphus orientalis]MDQ0315725.1 chromosomal replication initiation ATPase DnaA [Amorphus orientalis]
MGASNADAWAAIMAWPDWPHRTSLIIGAEGTGKTHLAAVWRERSGARIIGAGDLTDTDPVSLVQAGPLCVENCDRATLDEPVLFHLLNAVQAAGSHLLLTARIPPAEWRISTRDIASRLRAIPPLTIGVPEDELLERVLAKLFADRQLTVEPTVASYLVRRIERSFRAANRLVDLLDREALARRRPVTRRMAGEVLEAEGFGGDDDPDDTAS